MVLRMLSWRGKSIAGGIPSIIGSVVVREGNARRIGATVVNNGATIKFLVKGDLAAANVGIPLNPNGGAYEINLTNPWLGPISVYCAAAGENICFTEDE